MRLNKLDYIFVILQMFLFVSYIFNVASIDMFPEKNIFIDVISILLISLGILILGVSMLQLNKNLSPFPSPKTNSELITVGIYRYVRHPIYTGILMSTLGYGLYMNSEYKLFITLLLFILFYYKSRYEEQQLQNKFESYRDYKKKTGRFFPRIKF